MEPDQLDQLDSTVPVRVRMARWRAPGSHVTYRKGDVVEVDGADDAVARAIDRGVVEVVADDTEWETVDPDQGGTDPLAGYDDLNRDEIVALAGQRPELAAEILARESSRPKPRTTVLDPVEKIAEAYEDEVEQRAAQAADAEADAAGDEILDDD